MLLAVNMEIPIFHKQISGMGVFKKMIYQGNTPKNTSIRDSFFSMTITTKRMV